MLNVDVLPLPAAGRRGGMFFKKEAEKGYIEKEVSDFFVLFCFAW